MATLRDRLLNEIRIVRGTAPAMLAGTPAYTDQNPEVFNLANEPTDDHVMSDTVDSGGFDPFLGIQTVQGEDEALPYYETKRASDELDKTDHLVINTKEEPSIFWRPYTVTIGDLQNYEVCGIDFRRKRVTLINPSVAVVYLSRNANSPNGIADLSIPLLAGAALTLATVDQIYANAGGILPATPIRLAVIVEY